ANGLRRAARYASHIANAPRTGPRANVHMVSGPLHTATYLRLPGATSTNARTRAKTGRPEELPAHLKRIVEAPGSSIDGLHQPIAAKLVIARETASPSTTRARGQSQV